jgi:hypothetical protein
MRMVIFLMRLTRLLKETWSVDRIYHLGFLRAAAGAHHDGRALDFVGARGEYDGAQFDVNIMRHWNWQPVPVKDPSDPTTTQPADSWPKTFQDTFYRLDPKLNPHLDPKKYGAGREFELDVAFRLFQQVYDLSAKEGQDRGSNAPPPSTIGKESRAILHPDYFKVSDEGKRNGREWHFQHIHMQIGQ